MKLVTHKITIEELREMAKKMFGNLVKAVVDIEKKLMIVDADLHADQEACLLEQGSRQEYLWGINIYPELQGNDMIEFDSMINLRPSRGNHSQRVEDEKTRAQITEIVIKFITT